MWLKSLQLKNVKSFADSGKISFSKGINLLVGANNAGKTTVLRSIYSFQSTEEPIFNYLRKHRRVDTEDFEMIAEFAEASDKILPGIKNTDPKVIARGNTAENFSYVEATGKDNSKINLQIQSNEPANLFYPFLSRRKASHYAEQITLPNAQSISEANQNLYSKIDRISNSDLPEAVQFAEICEKIFGFRVSCTPSHGGKRAGYRVNRENDIPLEAMGEGSKNILSMAADMCVAEKKVFLIEEPENDLHPKALIQFLDFVLKCAERNQFIISTHSHIVLKRLGAHSSTRVFSVVMEIKERLPCSTITLVENIAERRIELLQDLGYELHDFDLFSGYLLLEESTAERVIRDFLIPYFVPELEGRIKTIAAQGIDDVEARFSDFLRLFVFVHTSEPTYRNKAWVIGDGDEQGKKIIERLRAKFQATWDGDHFQNFQEHQFEKYYPNRFKAEVNAVLILENGMAKQNGKKALITKVMAWIRDDPATAKTEIAESAEEVIEKLRAIKNAIEAE